ncbi:hypothetical protein LS68_008960 [Helicobacter sp. MIT 05-5293]|uniref:pentapeptide repeat-containing protein n=1 Tax=Helicobacter sp. MIT 05-5293 TaxID=1548149 RepID=UPI00068F6612|nr:pentapeptide repeat-containing protein [Helicobacter sp. MIT 05-5293]TLD79958.1 hypothetical protein LS68_008960 [Helicobacter sp. MIT 05-5293]
MKPITLKEFNAYAKTCSEENLHLLWEFLTHLSFNNDKRVVCQNNTLIVNVKMEFIRNDRQSEDLLCKELVFKDMHFMQDVSIDKVDDLILHIDNNVVFKNFLIKSIYEEETKGSINNLWIYKDFKCEEFIIMNYRIVSFVLSAHHIYGNLTFNECEYENFCYYFAEFHKFNFYGKILFLSCIFKNNAAFMNSIFHNRIDFKKSKFYTDAYFNNATFKEFADFHECEFEKTAVFYGVKFEKTPNFSQAIFEGNVNLVNAKLDFDFKGLGETIQKECETTADTKSLAECANDFRDSFRLFKNALIKDNNLLDASNHHRIELYCKEIELDSKISNAQASVKELIDSCVLKFYRHTSDHHTDLVKIISCVVISIGLFGILLFGIRYGLDLKSFVANHSNNFCAKLLDSSFIVESNMIGLLYICATCALFIKEIRFIFYLCVTIYMCAIQYKNIFLIFGNLTHSNANQSAAENLLIVIYAILMFLLIFSLQKTARKNSIVPH